MSIRLSIVALAIAVFLPSAALAQSSEAIISFDVQARLEQNRELSITEQITYDFGAGERHGIYRDIPVRYERNGGNYDLRLIVDDVTMDGTPAMYETDRRGDDLRIKIGDPEVFITGRHVYVISYHTDRAINFFDEEGGREAELYWNVTGHEWDYPIGSASITIAGPEGFDPASAGQDGATARVGCFTGVFGSTAQDCRTSGSGNSVSISTTAPLTAGEGLTVAVRFPAGLIAEPTATDRFWDLVADNWALILPLITLMAMLIIWHRHGRDPLGRGTVVPQYDPPRGLSPAEMIALKDQDIPSRAVTATILDLARRGYLKIEFGEEKGILRSTPTYAFIKVKEADASLSTAETEIFDGLFASGDRVELSDLKGKFYKAIDPFKKATFESLKSKGLFGANPAGVRGMYIGIAVGIGVMAIWFVGPFVNFLTSACLVASAAIIALIGWFMPKKTIEGAVVLEEVEGFKWFLSVTEKDRLKFHNAPAVKPAMFHAFLPAAIAFGVEEQWAEQFKGLEVPPPDYATGSILHHWMVLSFVHDLGRMNTAAASSAFAAPSSAGGGGSGFSGGGVGGGFGGGGGGSW